MSGLGSLLALGFWLGVRHAADADHVVAVSTFVARQRRLGAAWLLGAFWGLGHTVTIFLVGAAIILLKVTIPPRLGLGMELAVACVLVALGALNLGGVSPAGLIRRDHDGAPLHNHIVETDFTWLERTFGRGALYQFLRSGAVGLVHGLAGSAAIALLVLATVSSPRAGLLYLAVFGAGTLAGMLALSALMEASMLFMMRWWKTADRVLTAGTGLLSLAFGLYLIWDIGIVDGLFTSAPHWTPR